MGGIGMVSLARNWPRFSRRSMMVVTVAWLRLISAAIAPTVASGFSLTVFKIIICGAVKPVFFAKYFECKSVALMTLRSATNTESVFSITTLVT
jgi:hypothetical protein